MLDSKNEPSFCHPVFTAQEKPVADQSKIVAFSTTRQAPVLCNSNHSTSVKAVEIAEQNDFASFNLGLHVNDIHEHVLANRQQLQHYLPSNTKIQWLNQVHGDGVAEVKEVSSQALTADASYTRERNIALAIMTADCLPILIHSEDRQEIAAIHGGWRCLSANIIAKTLAKFSCENQKLSAWLGPCIGATAFEVGKEVFQAFIEQDTRHNNAFCERAQSEYANDSEEVSAKYLADLHQIAINQLQALGVYNIAQTTHCTYSLANQYYSYRRNAKTGRMAAIIALA